MVGKGITDNETLEAILKLCQKYNVEHFNTGVDGYVSISFRQQLPFIQSTPKPDQDPISDEEILMNPYAGMFSNTMPKKG